MKRILVYSVLLALGVCLNVSCAGFKGDVQLPDYPSYKVAVTKFLGEYSIAELVYPEEFQLAKMKDGWHARVVDLATKEVLKDELFWDRTKRRYTKVDFPDGGNDLESGPVKKIVDNWQRNYFTKILPFWGYSGWDKDVIDVYGEMEHLSDTLLNAVARSYASAASNLLNNNTGFAVEEDCFDLPDGMNALTKDQLAAYRKLQHKAIDTYYLLWQKNKDFESFVADAYNIYSNEVMNAYLTIRYHMNVEEARKELKDGLYDAFYIEMAKNYLSSCDSNAILFVNGDMDTYPLLYVQENEGFRKDVSVINYTMMGSGRYLAALIGDETNAGELSFSLDKDMYAGEGSEVVYVQDELEAVDLGEALAFVASEDKGSKLAAGDKYYGYIPSSNLTFDFNWEDVRGYSEEYMQRDEAAGGTFRIKIDRNYLLRSHLAFLDILSTNAFRRPLYFALSCGKDGFLGLEDYFMIEGVAYKMMPTKVAEDIEGLYPGYIDAEAQYEQLVERFRIEGRNADGAYYEGQKRMIGMYRICYYRLADELIAEGAYDEAFVVLDLVDMAYPGALVPYGYFDTQMIRSYYKLDELERANAKVEEMMAAAEATVRDVGLEQREGQVAVYILNELKGITEEYVGGSDVCERVKEVLLKPTTRVSLLCFSFRGLTVTTGVNNMASKSEMPKVTIIVIGRDLMKSPTFSGMAAIGKKASIVVSVALTAGHPISEAARWEASLLDVRGRYGGMK